MPVQVRPVRSGGRIKGYKVVERGTGKRAVKKTYASKTAAKKAATPRNLAWARKRRYKVPAPKKGK